MFLPDKGPLRSELLIVPLAIKKVCVFPPIVTELESICDSFVPF